MVNLRHIIWGNLIVDCYGKIGVGAAVTVNRYIEDMEDQVRWTIKEFVCFAVRREPL